MIMFECRKVKGAPQPDFRKCCACGETKHAKTSFYWSVQPTGTYPSGKCKECSAKWLIEYRSTRKAKYCEYAKNQRLRNPEKWKEIVKRSNAKTGKRRKDTYLESLKLREGEPLVCSCCGINKNSKADYYRFEQPCKKCRNERAKTARDKNPEATKERRRLEYQKNKEAAKNRAAKWKANNPERVKIIRLAYQTTEAAIAAQKQKSWFRRAKKKEALVLGEDPITKKWFSELCLTHGNRCYYCWNSNNKLTADHVTPLDRGGKHVRSNILPACGSCNSRKHNKLVSEWRPWIDIPLYGLDLASA